MFVGINKTKSYLKWNAFIIIYIEMILHRHLRTQWEKINGIILHNHYIYVNKQI